MQNQQVTYVFDDWNETLLEIAQDAIECCITSAYINLGSLGFLQRIACKMTQLNTEVTGKPIKILLDRDFAATSELRTNIINRLLALPGVAVRIYEGDRLLHRKNYIFRTNHDVRVVIGSVNATYSGFNHNLESAAVIYHDICDPEGQKIQDSFRLIWDSARPVLPNDKEVIPMAVPLFEKGHNVRIISTGKIGTINEIKPGATGFSYKVTVDSAPRMYQEKALERYIDEEEEIYAAFFSGILGGPKDFALYQTWFRLKKPIEGQLYSYLGSRTIFNPYQFKPLMKFLSAGSEERLFIADEVGVGKTIETGIILTELLARHRIDARSPILIVCPNSLGPKWEKEMRERFGLHFHLHDGSSFRHVLKTVIETGVVPDKYCWGIVSIHLLRQENGLLNKIDAQRSLPVWDIAVIDEAHHMRNIGTESNAAGNLLSSLSDRLVMLSATPLNLRDEDLFNQMYILNPAHFPDIQTFQAVLSPVKSINICRRLLMQNNPAAHLDIIKELSIIKSGPLGRAVAAHQGIVQFEKALEKRIPLQADDVAKYDRMLISLSPIDHSFTRTLKREAIGHRVLRQAEKIPVQLSPEEAEFHDSVVTLVQAAYLARGGNRSALGFISNMPRRMVSSCIPAMKEYLDWCLATNSFLSDESDSKEEIEEDTELSAQDLSVELRNAFIRLREQAEKLGQADTKYVQFLEVVRQMRANLENPRIIVFSFFIRTLKYLQRRLTEDGLRVGLICGEVPVISDGRTLTRYDIIDSLERNEIDILLSSEVGGEGLDFQFCQAMINYDLPYNPMRIEQRIGRIDRFGQKAEKVIVASMYIKGTVDEKIYDILYDRINLIQDSVGALEPILGSKFANLQSDIIEGNLSPDQIQQRVREIELAVEQAKLEMENFETNRRELMGDDFFTKPLLNLEASKEFVTPADAAGLSAMCLADWSGCSFTEISQDRAKITLSSDKVAALEQYMRMPGCERSVKEIGPLAKGAFPASVVFNGEIADRFKEHVFLPPCGFWTQFLLKQLEKEQKIVKTFMLQVESAEIGLPGCTYLVPLFEIKLEGFRVEFSIAAVPVNIESQQVMPVDYKGFAEKLRRVTFFPDSVTGRPDIEDPYVFVDSAREALDLYYDPILTELQNENKYRVESQIVSLQRGTEARIDKLQRSIQDHKDRAAQAGKSPSSEFIRLKEASMKHEQQRTDAKVESLAGKDELSKAVSVMGLAILKVSPASEEVE